MKTSIRRPLILAAAGSLAVSAATAQTVLIEDTFERNSATNYAIVNDGTVDGVQEFGFDYVTAGIPLAPRSMPGDRSGLRVTANATRNLANAITCFHNTAIDVDRYTLTVDVWSNFTPGNPFSTEHAHVGVAGDGVTFNQYDRVASVTTGDDISGSGAYIAFDGDGGSSQDYRWYRDPNNTPAQDASGVLDGAHPSYLDHGPNNSGQFFRGLFPSPPSTVTGSPGNIWTTLEIAVDNDTRQISFSFDGQLTFRGSFTNRFAGLVSLGLADTFNSLGPAESFLIYDNLEVVSNELIGAPYCPGEVNTSGVAGTLNALGSEIVADNDVVLVASSLPASAFGFFLVSPEQGFVPNPGGSAGNLCLVGMIGRYVGSGQIQNSGPAGSFALAVDLTNIPGPMGSVMTTPGMTWNFQGWHRDASPAGSTASSSNLTNGVSVTFL